MWQPQAVAVGNGHAADTYHHTTMPEHTGENNIKIYLFSISFNEV